MKEITMRLCWPKKVISEGKALFVMQEGKRTLKGDNALSRKVLPVQAEKFTKALPNGWSNILVLEEIA